MATLSLARMERFRPRLWKHTACPSSRTFAPSRMAVLPDTTQLRIFPSGSVSLFHRIVQCSVRHPSLHTLLFSPVFAIRIVGQCHRHSLSLFAVRRFTAILPVALRHFTSRPFSAAPWRIARHDCGVRQHQPLARCHADALSPSTQFISISCHTLRALCHFSSAPAPSP